MDQQSLACKAIDDALRGVEVVRCSKCTGSGRVLPTSWNIICPHCVGTGETVINCNEEAP